MITYTINLKQISSRRYVATIMANGKKFVQGQEWPTFDQARRDGNATLARVESLNGDWNGDHTTATYHYLQYQEA